MGTEFTVTRGDGDQLHSPRGDGDQVHGYTMGAGRFVAVVRGVGLNCELAEFDV